MHARRIFPVITALACLWIAPAALAQTQVQTQTRTALPELWTALAARLDDSKLKQGDTVEVKVLQGWVYQSCGMQQDTVLKGTVTSIEPWDPARKSTQLALGFDAVCMDGSHQPLVLMAVFYPDEGAKSQMDVFNAMPQGIGAGASGRQSTDIGRLPSPGQAPPEGQPLAKWGQVWRIPHLSLGLDKGPQGSTMLIASEKKLKLEAATRLVLVPVPAGK